MAENAYPQMMMMNADNYNEYIDRMQSISNDSLGDEEREAYREKVRLEYNEDGLSGPEYDSAVKAANDRYISLYESNPYNSRYGTTTKSLDTNDWTKLGTAAAAMAAGGYGLSALGAGAGTAGAGTAGAGTAGAGTAAGVIKEAIKEESEGSLLDSLIPLAGIAGTIYSGNEASDASSQAAATQAAASQAGIDETVRQYDSMIDLMSPYVGAGTGALKAQKNLIGLGGAEAQQQAITGIEQSPLFGSMVQQGEEAILQNASATGGLRGGNTQSALAQFRPQVLSQLIESQYSKLGGLSQQGQSAAAGQGAAGLNTGANISNLYAQQGAAQAGGILGSAAADQQTISNLGQIGATYLGAGGIPSTSSIF